MATFEEMFNQSMQDLTNPWAGLPGAAMGYDPMMGPGGMAMPTPVIPRPVPTTPIAPPAAAAPALPPKIQDQMPAGAPPLAVYNPTSPVNPAVAKAMVDDPDGFARAAARAGIEPPQIPSAAPSVGAALIEDVRPEEMLDGGGKGQARPMGDSLAKAFQGVKPPEAPTPNIPRVSTPAVPTPRPIQGGDIFKLLQMIGGTGQAVGAGYKLPSTFGAALGR